MSDIEAIVPFIIKWEAGTTGEGLSNVQLFNRARKTGWSNDPVDTGGATMIGVTFDTYKAFCRKRCLAIPPRFHPK